MKKDNSLVEIKSNKIGFKKFISNTLEFIKSKIDKNYTLSLNSPEFLKQNKNLIIKTIQRDSSYLNQVPNELLLEELQYEDLPSNGIIDTAFRYGYMFDSSSPQILLSKNAKSAIFQYMKIASPNVIEVLDKELFSDIDFRDELVSLAIQNGYRITSYSQTVDKVKKFLSIVFIFYKEYVKIYLSGIEQNGSKKCRFFLRNICIFLYIMI